MSTKPQQITENSETNSDSRARSLANLKPFKPGQSGNPGGRPKGIFGRTALKRLLRRAKNGEPQLLALIDAQIAKARKGDTRAAEFLRDSVDGRPSAHDDGSQIGGGSVNIVWGVPLPEWAKPPSEPEAQPIDVPMPFLESAKPPIKADAVSLPPSDIETLSHPVVASVQPKGKDDSQQQDTFVPYPRAFIAGHRPDCQCAECAALTEQMRA